MKSRYLFALLGVSIVFAGALLLHALTAPRVQAAGGCNASQFQGGYGFSGGGEIVNGGGAGNHEALEGSLLANGISTKVGTLQGNLTLSSNGHISRTSFTGSYTMSAGCGGSAVIRTASGLTMHFDFTLVEWSNSGGGIAEEVLFIETDPRSVVTMSLTHG